MRTYSPFLQTIYDQSEPVGSLGRGTHYSILRALNWRTVEGAALEAAVYRDFSIIWDEDHDHRVIASIEAMYAHGLLFPVLFIGERKGGLSVVVDPNFPRSEAWQTYQQRVEELTQNLPDAWGSDVTVFGDADASLINDSPERVSLYLSNIQMLWSLGNKPTPKVGFGPVSQAAWADGP